MGTQAHATKQGSNLTHSLKKEQFPLNKPRNLIAEKRSIG